MVADRLTLKDRVIEVVRSVIPDAEFDGLRQSYGRVDGYIVAESFEDVPVDQRYAVAWDQVRKKLGADAARIGSILLFAPGEGA
ncbi:hypothetical protein BH11ARM2_BH11ARM2_23600 [soil metagenome]